LAIFENLSYTSLMASIPG